MLNLQSNYRNALAPFKFIDLFAGIGGFHLALSSFGAKCVFTSEWDTYAREVYEKNFGIKPLVFQENKMDLRIREVHYFLK
jgi:DNA (cytosine-5)-methyltransferase 1